MAQPLDNYIMLKHIPAGRMTSAERLVRQQAVDLGDAELVALCDDALVRLAEARALGLAWRRQPARPTRGNAKEIDPDVDRMLRAIESGAQQKLNLRRNPERQQQATEFLAHFFPDGANAVCDLPYDQEREACVDILEDLHADQWRPVVAALGLTDFVEELTVLVEEYGAALDAPVVRTLKWEQVTAAVAKARAAVLDTMAYVLGHYRGDRAETRDRLLAPIRFQEQDMARYQRGRKRVVVDIDPDTGEPELPPGVTEPAPADPVVA